MKKPKTYAETKMQIGGLMRCCTATIGEFVRVNADKPVEFGRTIDCTYETPGNKNIIVDEQSGNFRWNRVGG